MALYRVYGEETVSVVTTIEASSPEEAMRLVETGRLWDYVNKTPPGMSVAILSVEEI